MKALATTGHVLKTNLCQHRVYLMLFALLSLCAVIVERAALPRGMGEALLAFLRLAQLIGFGLIVAQVFLTDSVSDSTSQWWARPISTGNLIAAKIAYVILGVWLPLMVISLAGWLYDGFSLRQLALAAAELTLYAVGTAALVGGMAALSSQFWIFVGTATCTCLAAMFILWLTNVLHWREGANSWTISSSGLTTLVFAVFFAVGAGCLVAVFGLRARVWAYVSLLVLVSSALWLPSVEPFRLDEHSRNPNSAIELESPGADASRSSALMQNVSVIGLGEHEFATPLTADFNFVDGQGQTAHFTLRRREGLAPRSAMLTVAGYELVQSHLPEDVRWVNGLRSNLAMSSSPQVSHPKNLDREQPGRLVGEMEFMLHEVRYLGELSLTSGSGFSDRGHRIQLFDVSETDRELAFEVRTMRPSLLWSRSYDDRGLGQGLSLSSWVIVAYYPDRRLAELVQVNPYQFGGPFPVVGRGRTRVSFSRPRAVGGAESSLQLHAFRVMMKGAYTHAFDWDRHVIETDLKPDREATGGGRRRIDSDAESGIAAADAIESVEDLAAFPLEGSHDEREKLRKLAAGLFADDVEAAMRLVPWPDPLHWTLWQTLNRELTEAHVSSFREALRRDPRLMELVEKKRWAGRFADEIARELAKRHPNTDPSVVRMALRLAEDGGSQISTDDLAWHYVYNRRIHRGKLYSAISVVPGLDGLTLLRQTWERTRWMGHRRDLVGLAMEHGLPGALEEAMRQLYGEGIVEQENDSIWLTQVRQATAYSGDWRGFYDWIAEHGGSLVYDAELRKYRVSVP